MREYMMFIKGAIPSYAVVDQDPAVGHRVKRGRRIVVVLSKGPRYYEVPDVQRVSLREARLQLEGNQLQIGQTRYLSSTSIPAASKPSRSCRFIASFLQIASRAPARRARGCVCADGRWCGCAKLPAAAAAPCRL